MVHEKVRGPNGSEATSRKYRGNIETGSKLVTGNAKNALGSDVDGYVMPMFNSQTAIACNPALVRTPPKSYAELAEWAKARRSSSATTASRAARQA